MSSAMAAVDVVIPVYNAPDDLRRCVESVLACTAGDYALVLIDDASPDPRVRAYFDELAARRLPHVTLLANASNLGFTGTANRGMTRSRADVVLLNSDTIVTRGWLDALRRCVASDARIGTATPFSNNAEICSWPRFCENNPWPQGADPEPVRASIAAAAVPCYPDLPTGVGFCLYVRRALIDAIGAFDPAFGAGYGEENDFCMRAAAAGFRNVLCDDAFVVHVGGRSFEGAKETLGVRNTALLLERHPGYLDLVRDYIEQDPLEALREAARTAHDRRHGPALAVLHVLHGGGGTEAQVRLLVEATRATLRHALAVVKGDTWRVEEHRSDGSTKLCEFARRPDEPLEDFLRMLCANFGAGVVHLHNISGSREPLQDAMPRLGIPYGYTAHDLSFACPTITLTRADGYFCGGVTDAAACAGCLAEQRMRDVDIERWRERHAALLAGAAFVIAPSRFAADLLRRYFPAVNPAVIAHGLPGRVPRRSGARQVVLMPADDVATVAVVGAVGPDKGSRRIEQLADRVARAGASLRFVVIGYTDHHHRAWQSDDARLTVHGRYDPRDLPWLLDHYRAPLVLFPSLGPETFAFTLSEAWSAGRAVLVPPVGALAERVRDSGAGWIMTDDEWRDDALLLARIERLLAPANAETLAEATRLARALTLPTVEAMAAATIGRYVDAHRALPVSHPPVDRLRVVEAYGFRRWAPQSGARPGDDVAAPAPSVTIDSLGDVGRRLRATAAGRMLYRLLPEGVRAALKPRDG
jgi:GT2 family glycosyltransferase/glycosyltransferase involved in cell wall biosynthesis